MSGERYGCLGDWAAGHSGTRVTENVYEQDDQDGALPLQLHLNPEPVCAMTIYRGAAAPRICIIMHYDIAQFSLVNLQEVWCHRAHVKFGYIT